MGASCCEHDGRGGSQNRPDDAAYRRVLWAVLALWHVVALSSIYFAFSILVTVNWPLMRSGTNLTLSPALTVFSMDGS